MRVRMLTEAEGAQDAKVEMLKRCEEVIQQQQARPFKKKRLKKLQKITCVLPPRACVSPPEEKKGGQMTRARY
jgi:hypothetical protein